MPRDAIPLKKKNNEPTQGLSQDQELQTDRRTANTQV